MKRYFLIILWFFWCHYALAAVMINVDPKEVALGETVRITLTLDNPQAGGVPDLTPLQQHFTIVGTERSTSYTVINGQAKSIFEWGVLLVPKEVGVLSIPAIKIGQQQSPPSQVTVTAPVSVKSSVVSPTIKHEPPPSHVENDAVILRTEVSQENPFVNEQVIYTVKLMTRDNLLNVQYQPPQVKDALLMSLGDSRHYQTQLGAYQYDVEEQQYAIFPQKTGRLTIKPPFISGLVYDIVPQRVLASGKSYNLNVKAIPAQSSMSAWLPAKNVTLSEKYDRLETEFLRGSTLERTITLHAVGVPAQLLPELAFSSSKQWGAYPDKPNTQTKFSQQNLMSTTSIKVTYLLNTAGQQTLPKIEIPWFNTVTRKNEMVSLPAKTLTVVAANTSKIGTRVNDTKPSSTPSSMAGAAKFLPPPMMLIEIGWIIAGVILVLMMIAGLGWLLRRLVITRRNKQRILKQLHDACMRHDPLLARKAILQWAAQQWPEIDIFNLNDLIKQIDTVELKKQLHRLSQALYGQSGQTTWQGEALWRCVVKFKPKQAMQKTAQDPLPPMNP